MLEGCIVSNSNIIKLLNKISKIDEKFTPFYEVNKKYKFDATDEYLYNNKSVRQVGEIFPIDTLLGYVYYIKNNDTKIYIWFWVDENNNIIEIEFYSLNGKIIKNIIDLFLKEDIKKEENNPPSNAKRGSV